MSQFDDDYVDIQPWPVREIAGHLLALATVVRRGMLDLETDLDPFERETDRFELESWARLELSPFLDQDEIAWLEAPLDTLAERDDFADERFIAASTIGWAVRVPGLDNLPIELDPAIEQRLLDWAPGPWTPLGNVAKGFRLRSDEDLASERERWEVILWRCELFQDDDDLDEDRLALQDAVAELSEIDPPLVDVTADDIVLADGTPFSDIAAERLSEIGLVASIRLRTLNWVCGYGQSPMTAPLYLDDENA